MAEKIPVELTGVPETLLWNLYHRSVAARGPRPMLDDPRAVETVERLDYPFEKVSTGPVRAGAAWHAQRVQTFDRGVRRFLDAHPDATVVALGEGLETQFWRVDNGRVRWLTVELPETAALRRQVLRDGARQRTIECSAADPRWMDAVDASRDVLITAQGLLMYLTLDVVERLLNKCAERFPGASLLFDAIPGRMIAARERWAKPDPDGGVLPRWLWGIDPVTRRRLSTIPGVAELGELTPARGSGVLFGLLVPVLRRVPVVREHVPVFPVFEVGFHRA